jgi:DNA-binding transcriptional MocR family regulator
VTEGFSLYQWRDLILSDSGPRDRTVQHALLVLASWLNRDTLRAWPSHRTIAHKMHVSHQTVGRALRKAAAMGWLVTVQTAGERQGWRRNFYLAAIPANVWKAAQSREGGPPGNHATTQSCGGGPSNTEGGPNRAKSWSAHGPELLHRTPPRTLARANSASDAIPVHELTEQRAREAIANYSGPPIHDEETLWTYAERISTQGAPADVIYRILKEMA